MFIDRATIEVNGGAGGSGSEAYRREKGVPRGGPAGGDGGDGGDVIILADIQLSTLMDFRYRKHHKAERGLHGSGNKKTGKSGSDLIIRVPSGTVVKDADTHEFIGELIKSGDRLVVAKGGRGGRGNTHFTTSTNQTPLRFEQGEKGEERRVELELKLIADIGLVGKPNSGKSTLLGNVSSANPKVADYPFTTLEPNLGIVELADFRTFVIADIPGIIEGAHEGKGLGLKFLRHIERTRTLALLVSVDSPDPQSEYRELRKELAAYSADLRERPHCVVLTKSDLLNSEDSTPYIEAPEAWAIFTVSSVSRSGLNDLLEALWGRTQESLQKEDEYQDLWSSPGIS